MTNETLSTTPAKTPIRKLTATTPYGVQARKTHRVYTHVVVAIGTHEALIRQRAADGLKHDEKMVAKYSAVVEKGFSPYGSSTLEDYKRWLAASQRSVETADDRLTQRLADNAAAIASNKVAVCEWAGRPDLAEKTANKLRKEHYKVEIYPVD